jgi:integrase
MQKMLLTDRKIRAWKAPEKNREEVADEALSGFYFRVTPNGKKSFSVLYRNSDGALRRYTVGRYPAKSLSDAREDAREIQRRVERGEDPAAEKKAEKHSAQPPKDTVEAVAEEYVKRYCKPNLRSWTETERILNKYVKPTLGKHHVRDVSRRDVRDLIDGIVDEGKPVQANRVLAAAHAMFNWAVEREIVEANPAAGIKKPTKEKARERILTDEELRKVWQTSEQLGYPASAYIKTLILTGARRDEAREMRWREVDLDKGLWTIPGERAKNGEPHVVPLSSDMKALLEALPRFDGGDYVFTATNGSTPYSNVIKPKKRIERDSGVKGWTLHDLRRTAASGMGDLGIAGETIARVLNHSERAIAGVTARYNRADQTEAKRRALEAWSQRVAEIVRGKKQDNVVALNG